MPLAFSENLDECTPLVIGPADHGRGSRLGGRPPDGIEPRVIPNARYFATIVLTTHPTEEASLFFPMAGDVVAAPSGTIHSGLIEVIVHGESRRGTTNHSGGLPEHSLVSLPTRHDWSEDEEGRVTIESTHKYGGRPFLIRREEVIEAAVRDLFDTGYFQVLQLDFPVGDDDVVVDGPWPFADGMFHLFGRRAGATWDWRWFWDL